MASLAIFIDGGYTDRVLADRAGRVRVDYDRLSERVRESVDAASAEGVDRFRTYYYICPPYQDDSPDDEQRQRMAGYQRFRFAIRRLSRFQVREGRLERQGFGTDGQPIFVQKRVDVLFGLDVALLSAKPNITHVALLAGDSDFLPAVEVAKQEGVSLWLFHGPPRTYSQELWNEADERVEMNSAFMEAVRRA